MLMMSCHVEEFVVLDSCLSCSGNSRLRPIQQNDIICYL